MMWNRLRRWLNDILIKDPIARQQAPLLQMMLISVILVAALRLLSFPINNSDDASSWLDPGMSTMVLIDAVIALGVLRAGRFRFAVLLATTGFLFVLGIALINTGLHSSGLVPLIFVLPITLAGLLAGRRGLLFTGALSVAIVAITAFLELRSPPLAGFAPLPNPPADMAISFALITGLLVTFLGLFGQSLRKALAVALDHEQKLEQARASLQKQAVDLAAANVVLEREIAERRRAEQALRESEERYRLITENSSDLISLLDLAGAGSCIYVSPSYKTLLGYEPEQLLGPLQLKLVHPDDRANVIEQYARLVATGNASVTYRLRHAGGSWRSIELHASTINQPDLHYAVTVGRDVTERKNLEAQLMQSQRLESIGRLAGGVAHDFNNLLTTIVGNTELALDSLPADHPVRADLSEIAQSADRATGLTRQLLAFARKQLIEPRPIDLNQLVLEMDKLLRRLIGEDIELATLLETDLWRVRADPGQIEQVIINLAVNARDAMPNGGKLTIETKNVLLDHDYAHRHISASPGTYVLLAISDTGTGMDEETQGQIFEPFFTTKAPGYGTGLGLATCYGIVKQHGGNIWPYSEPGHGSTFKIYLPQFEAPAEARPQPIDAGGLPRGTETILLAEDEPSVRMLAARVLRSLGYTVIEATNGDEALKLAQSADGPVIKFLLTDVVMPQMSGQILAERIKEHHPDIKVLFISGYTDNAIVHHGELDRHVIFLQKPFSPSALARKVRAVLDATPFN